MLDVLAIGSRPDEGLAVVNDGMPAKPGEGSPQCEPKPLWAVALDMMRDENGNARTSKVTLTPTAAIAFVNHYLHTSELLGFTEDALRERNARLDRIERIAKGQVDA